MAQEDRPLSKLGIQALLKLQAEKAELLDALNILLNTNQYYYEQSHNLRIYITDETIEKVLEVFNKYKEEIPMADRDKDFTDLDFDSIVHQTQLAIIFDFGNEEHQGIPIAHIDMDNFDPEEDKTVPVKVWFAKNNGLI